MNHFTQGGGQTFSVGVGGGDDDVDGEENVREANSYVSEVSNLSAGARIIRSQKGPEILV